MLKSSPIYERRGKDQTSLISNTFQHFDIMNFITEMLC